MDEPTDPFWLLLRTGRTKAGLSVRRAAKKAGISEGRWRQLERGYQSSGSAKIPANPRADTVVRIAEAIGLDANAALQTAGIDADAEEVRRQMDSEQHVEAIEKIARGPEGFLSEMESLGLNLDRQLAFMKDAHDRGHPDEAKDSSGLPKLSLVERIEDLNIDELKRLRGMIDETIAIAEEYPQGLHSLRMAHRLSQARGSFERFAAAARQMAGADDQTDEALMAAGAALTRITERHPNFASVKLLAEALAQRQRITNASARISEAEVLRREEMIREEIAELRAKGDVDG